MFRTSLIAAVLAFGLMPTAHADDSQPAAKAPEAPAVEQKSFFESRTLEDIEKMVHIDASLTEGSADLSSQGAG